MVAEKEFSNFYNNKSINKLYPTEFVIRTFLGKYPSLELKRDTYSGKKILDLGFGDGRNIEFLRNLDFDVYGVETCQQIIDSAKQYLNEYQINAQLYVGHNADIPFESNKFDYVLACHSCYYLNNDDLFDKNLDEIARVMKTGATLIASVPVSGNFILNNAKLSEGCYAEITDDPYSLRNGDRIKYFESQQDAQDIFSKHFEQFSFATLDENYYGIRIRAYVIVCKKR